VRYDGIMEIRSDSGKPKVRKITAGGQVSLPAAVRRRWQTKNVGIEDRGDHVIVRPLADDPIAAARGALKGRLGSAADLRRKAREDEAAAESEAGL
jgi:bifunctional DNA-binding transcriptional regulator/antitoxin component of YhaV-PrlF toxin-antitoxin module